MATTSSQHQHIHATQSAPAVQFQASSAVGREFLRGLEQRGMFSRGFVERRDLEQYFWSDNTVRKLTEALVGTEEGQVCCLTTPTIAELMWCEHDREERLLDIDRRFAFLPKYMHFDIQNPCPLPTNERYWILVVDPPFFYIPMEQIFKAVKHACRGDFSTKLLIGFLRREEASLMQHFKPFKIRRTTFDLEYTHVKPNKWRNYALYSNVSLPGIRFAKK